MKRRILTISAMILMLLLPISISSLFNDEIDTVSAETAQYTQSSNNNLASLSSSVVAINFSASVTTYNVSVANNITTINLRATAADSKATVNISGDSNFIVGSNRIIVKVTAENGGVKYYYVNVTRNEVVKSSNNNLSTLSTTLATINFSTDIAEYNITVDNSVTSLALAATAADSKASVKIEGDSNFVVGSNSVKVNVTAENGAVKKYTINVTRSASNNNNLTSISISNLSTPINFSQDVFDYSITITDPNVTSLDFNLSTEDNTATTTVTGNTNLVEGENTIKIVVKAANGEEKTYTIIATKKLASPVQTIVENAPWLPIIIGVGLVIIGVVTFLIIKRKKTVNIVENESKEEIIEIEIANNNETKL